MNFSQVRSSKGWIVILATVVGLALGPSSAARAPIMSTQLPVESLPINQQSSLSHAVKVA
jgi:hypothetical protein